MTSDLEIARSTKLRPILDVGASAGIPATALLPYGRFKAKVDFDFISSLRDRPTGALVLVTGISPTPAGEGKTTTTIGLGDALNASGRRTMICLREPSLGPCFGAKGGATGGGHAQVAPSDEINLHFTGDFHAITTANNLLSALIDNHVYWGNGLSIDPGRITWRRAVDLNDRSLRQIVAGLGGVKNGRVREDKFDITVASEVMAILCLARDLDDMQARLARIIVATRRDGSMITAADVGAVGAMTALLRDAAMPNLVQTLAGSPALVHGGPFANIAHGCNSVIATNLGLKLADIVVTEAGFGADLGGEKFFDIKCRLAGLKPACAVIVATVRALKMHGGLSKAELGTENVPAVRRGTANLVRHVENTLKFGVPVVVALNRFDSDTDAEMQEVSDAVAPAGIQVIPCTHWADGAAGASELAARVGEMVASHGASFRPLYSTDLPLAEKVRTIAHEIYRASDVAFSPNVEKTLAAYERAGFRDAPVCIAKTQYSFSANAELVGAPEGQVLPIREVRLSAGAGFVVALTGDVSTMPGLPRHPAANRIHLGPDGAIEGLF